jgi:metallo-beta-lactamase class B
MLHRLMLALSLGAIMFIQTQSAAAQNKNWTRPLAPFRIISNIYWVGSYDLATYLITTPQGHILINTGVGDTPKQIKASVDNWDSSSRTRESLLLPTATSIMWPGWPS